MLDRIFRQAELMDRMMETVGVAPMVAARVDKGVGWYEARTRCIACCREQECRQWLQRTPAATGAPPDFCVNAEFFRRCLLGSRTVEAGPAAAVPAAGVAESEHARREPLAELTGS
jgi:hypothetical protein